jgi:hypothetical protein
MTEIHKDDMEYDYQDFKDSTDSVVGSLHELTDRLERLKQIGEYLHEHSPQGDLSFELMKIDKGLKHLEQLWGILPGYE